MNCKHCDTPLIDPHPNRRFCSQACRNGHHTATAARCSEGGCETVVTARGLCLTHYSQARFAGEFTAERCKAPNCQRAMTSRGYCQSHYSSAVARGEFGPKMQRRAADYHRRRLYGLSLADLDRMRAEQGDRCAICSDELGRGHVDHDHATGRVRALLCSHCNLGLGHFRDRPERLAAAIDYLSLHTDRRAAL